MAILTVQFVVQTHFTVTTICQNLSQSMAAIHDSVVIIMYAFLSTQLCSAIYIAQSNISTTSGIITCTLD